MIKVKNVRPGLLLIADVGLKLAPGETALVEKLTAQMENCLENGLLTRIEPEPEAKPRLRSGGKNTEPKPAPPAKDSEPAVTADNTGDSGSAMTGEVKALDLPLKTEGTKSGAH
ncbi:MAG: hypothetical protein M1335_08275 [Chloroflexi bacterium]|nr:hypothetical protein [Chloroflexota bacterium]